MSGGEIAALIAAGAFAVLVVAVVRLLGQIGKTVQKAETTVTQVNQTIQVLTRDVDILVREVEGLLVKSNELMGKVNQKVETIDPLFDAVADLSTSVSDLNASGREMATRFATMGKSVTQASIIGKVSQATINRFKHNQTKANNGGKVYE